VGVLSHVNLITGSFGSFFRVANSIKEGVWVWKGVSGVAGVHVVLLLLLPCIRISAGGTPLVIVTTGGDKRRRYGHCRRRRRRRRRR